MTDDASAPARCKRDKNLTRLYWITRLGIAFIWSWTAFASWFAWPHAESLDWLGRLGLGSQAHGAFVAACLLDLALGIASLLFASRRLWQMQGALVLFYSIVIVLWLPEFVFHPFGPISKNVAVLACLGWLAVMEER